MKELFFSLVSRKLFIALLESGKVIRIICEDNYHRHSENFILKVKEIFDGISFLVGDLSKVFFLTGPGGQTGERVSFSFVLGSLLSNPVLKAFSLDSLTFQAVASERCLSVVSTGEKSKKYFFAVYQGNRVLFRKEKVEKEEFEKVREMFPNLVVRTDLEETDFLRNFLVSKKEFRAFESEQLVGF